MTQGKSRAHLAVESPILLLIMPIWLGIQQNMRWYQKVLILGLHTRKVPFDSSLGTIPFKIVNLCSDTELPVLLPLLERVLEVQDCQALSAVCMGSPPQCRNGNPSAASSSSGKGRSCKRPNLAIRAGTIGSPCCYGQETHALWELDDRVNCRLEAINCTHSTVQAISTQCIPSSGSEHCSRTCHWWCGAQGWIHGGQPHLCWRKRWACSWSCCRPVSSSSVMERLGSSTAKTGVLVSGSYP